MTPIAAVDINTSKYGAIAVTTVQVITQAATMMYTKHVSMMVVTQTNSGITGVHGMNQTG